MIFLEDFSFLSWYCLLTCVLCIYYISPWGWLFTLAYPKLCKSRNRCTVFIVQRDLYTSTGKKPYLNLCWRFWINTHHNKALNGHCSYTSLIQNPILSRMCFGQYQASTAVLGWCIQVEGSLIKRNTKLIGQGLQQKMTLTIR